MLDHGGFFAKYPAPAQVAMAATVLSVRAVAARGHDTLGSRYVSDA
jgi:hypothetical protein